MSRWTILPEAPADAPALHALTIAAFRRASEANVLASHRTYDPAYEAQLSLVAWAEDHIIGHVLFTPATVRLAGADVSAVAVGPVTVAPHWQRQGVGAALMEAGHARARERGATLAFLIGHPSYYPRLGYEPLFGFCQAPLTPERLPPGTEPLLCRPVAITDGPWLAAQHRREWQDVDFAWMRGGELGAWTVPGAETVLWWTRDGRRAAYTQKSADGQRCLVVADDAALARQVLLTLRPPRLDHHPHGWLARTVLPELGCVASVARAAPCMARALVPSALDAVRDGWSRDAVPGSTTFPVSFLAF